MTLNPEIYMDLVRRALAEDVGSGDITTEYLNIGDIPGTAKITAKEDGVIAGLPVAEAVFRELDPNVEFKALVEDGAQVRRGTQIAEVNGRAASLLTAERVSYSRTEQGLQSTRTPLGLTFQGIWFSRRNWVGLNPFAFVTAVSISCSGANTSSGTATVRVDRTRALGLASPYLVGFVLAPVVPLPAAIIAVAACTGLIWFIVCYVAGHLLERELSEALADRAA